MKLFASWSGGKDSSLALHRVKMQGHTVCCLVNMIAEDSQHSRTHGVSAAVLRAQAEAIGIPLIQRPTTWDTYERDFKKVLVDVKEDGVEGGIYGDIDLDEHREWVERVSRESDLQPFLPLWCEAQETLMREFIDTGFEAVVVSVVDTIFDSNILGRQVDNAFLDDLLGMSKNQLITPCGEAGEYHTLVLDGPFFRKKLVPLRYEKVQKDGHWLLDITEYGLQKK